MKHFRCYAAAVLVCSACGDVPLPSFAPVTDSGVTTDSLVRDVSHDIGVDTTGASDVQSADAAMVDTTMADAGIDTTVSVDQGVVGTTNFSPDFFTPICDGAWCWSNPGPTGFDLNRIAEITPNNVLAVGHIGSILRYDGATWSIEASGTDKTLNDIWAVSPTSIYVVGSTGTILHYDGTQWGTIDSGTSETFYGVWGTSDNSIYIAGGSGNLHHYDGNSVSLLHTGTDTLYGIDGSSEQNVIAVGEHGRTVHCGSGVCLEAPPQTTHSLRDVRVLSTTEATAVGGGGTVLRYNGSTWAPEASGVTATLYAIVGSAQTDLHVVGSQQTYLQRHTTGWLNGEIQEFPAGIIETITQVSGGGLLLAGLNGAMVYHDGLAWHGPADALGYPDIRDLWADAAGNVIGVGSGGTVLSRTLGSGWAVSETLTSGTLYAIDGTSINDLYVVGSSGFVAHFDGVNWNQVTTGSTSTYQDIYVADAANMVIVGFSGAVSRQTAGTWVNETVGTSTLRAAWGTGPSDMFIGGTGGHIHHWDGVSWTEQSTPTSHTIYDIWGTAANNIYAVGSFGTVLHYDGTAWQSQSVPVNDTLRVVNGTSPTDIYAAGNGLFRTNGTAWSTPAGAPKLSSGNSIYGLVFSQGQIIAGGWGGMLLEHTP